MDDTGSVGAASSVTLPVLANDSDDGLGRPDGERPHLEVAGFDTLDGRVSVDSTKRTLVLATRAADAGSTLTLTYTATDGELTSAPATVTVTVAAAPRPPAPPRVTLYAPREVVALHRVTLHGALSPVPVRPGRATVQRLVGGRWRPLASDRADAKGRYAVAFSTDRAQRYVFRTVATWPDGRHATSPAVDPHRRRPTGREGVRAADPQGGPLLLPGRLPGRARAGCAGSPSTGSPTATWSPAAPWSCAPAPSPTWCGCSRASFASRFPVRSMRPTDVFYAGGRRTPTQSDVAAMKADNTSAFNCRPVTGNPYRVSQHSYGNAIDINTVRNPYVVGPTRLPLVRPAPTWTARTSAPG